MSDDENEGLIEGSRCANCGEAWEVGRTERQVGAIATYQAGCTNSHGCGLKGPRNHWEDIASEQALKLGLYTDQRHLENRLNLRVAELEAKARQREEHARAVRLEIRGVCLHLLVLVEKLEAKT
jgi:hypothetical protein